MAPPIWFDGSQEPTLGIFHFVSFSGAKSHILIHPDRYIWRVLGLLILFNRKVIRPFIPIRFGLLARSTHDWGPRLPT